MLLKTESVTSRACGKHVRQTDVDLLVHTEGTLFSGSSKKLVTTSQPQKLVTNALLGVGAAHRAACVPHNLKTLLYGPFKPGSKLTMPFDETHTGIDSLRGASRAYTVQ